MRGLIGFTFASVTRDFGEQRQDLTSDSKSSQSSELPLYSIVRDVVGLSGSSQIGLGFLPKSKPK